LLVGKLPSELVLQGDRIERLSLPSVGVEVPGAILSRRPDLARAEADLRAADAQVDAARAALLPTLQLSAGGSLATSTLLSLSDPTRVLSLTGSLAQNLFDGGKLRRQVDISEVGVKQSWESYRKTLLTAVKEVEDALVNVERQGTQELNQSAVRDEAQRSLQLSEQRYKAGAAGLSDVLDAQRTFFSAQDQLAQIRLSRLSASVDLIKALGGGWQAPRRSSSDTSVNAVTDELKGVAEPSPKTGADS
jgi:NodT family efflux transporter outer membrane factor (OMF) lipoprotein